MAAHPWATIGVVASFRDIAEAAVWLSGHAVSIRDTPRSEPMPKHGYRPFDPPAAPPAPISPSYAGEGPGAGAQGGCGFRLKSPPTRRTKLERSPSLS